MEICRKKEKNNTVTSQINMAERMIEKKGSIALMVNEWEWHLSKTHIGQKVLQCMHDNEWWYRCKMQKKKAHTINTQNLIINKNKTR